MKRKTNLVHHRQSCSRRQGAFLKIDAHCKPYSSIERKALTFFEIRFIIRLSNLTGWRDSIASYLCLCCLYKTFETNYPTESDCSWSTCIYQKKQSNLGIRIFYLCFRVKQKFHISANKRQFYSEYRVCRLETMHENAKNKLYNVLFYSFASFALEITLLNIRYSIIIYGACACH